MSGALIISCHGKVGFDSKGAALEMLARRRRRNKRGHAHKNERASKAAQQPYRCTFCHQWHIG